MKKLRIFALALALLCVLPLLIGCGKKNDPDADKHPAITMLAPYRNMSAFYNLVHEKYPEINLEIIPYNGSNYSAYVLDMRAVGQMPDIYFTSYYVPGRGDDAADFLDLSGYAFTDNFAQSRLREVTNNGGVYMLPMGYNALGITYNKTLLEAHGWTLPQNLTEMAELKEKAEAAGLIFCRVQLQYPGYGFQYLCNILDTDFLSTTGGIAWQNAFVEGKATVAGTPKMLEALNLLERWRDLGLLNGDGTPDNDDATRWQMLEGNTLFLVGNSNDLNAKKTDQNPANTYRLMPYLSENGDQNVFILNVSRYVGLNKKLGEAGNEQKLEDALHIMELLSTAEGIESLDPTQNNSRLLPLKDAVVGEDNYYSDILDVLNNGHTAAFIYSGWENVIVPYGEKMIEYVKGNASLEDVIACFDDGRHLMTDNTSEIYTTVTETIGTEDCARLVGIAFGEATGAEAALVSVNTWINNPDTLELNNAGVSGSLFPMGITEQEIVSVLPTGWRKNIDTVTLSGRRIKELAAAGYDANGDGTMVFPYVLVTKGGETLNDDTVYTIPICGVSDAVAAEGSLTDSGILGLDAAKTYLGRFDTFSAKDIVWEK